MRIIYHFFQIFVAVLLANVSVGVAAATSDAALYDLWRSGNLAQMERIAEKGDLRAQRWMGLMLHHRGRYDEAMGWYQRAAEQGDGRSAKSIAFFYDVGVGRPKDPQVGIEWHRKAAERGDFGSQLRYASALRTGTLLQRNEKEAFNWYVKAAAMSGPAQKGYAYLPLAEMYVEGTAVPQNFRRAYAYAKAAEVTVDDSDAQSQSKARDVQRDAAARLTPGELRSAEKFLNETWPDLPKRSVGWLGAFAIIGLSLFALGVLAIFGMLAILGKTVRMVVRSFSRQL